jgi:dihydroanticapsin dehydrogenase
VSTLNGTAKFSPLFMESGASDMGTRLQGKRAVITGAATGIGRAAVERFVSEGARVVFADINQKDGAALAAKYPEDVRFIACDVTGEAAVAALIEDAAAFLGGIDILINNAGLLSHKVVTSYSAEEWDRVFAVNVRSNFLTIKHAVPHLRQAGGGSIINMSSIAGLRGGPGASAYAASKAAVNGLTIACALEFAPDKIRVNSICPGWIDTPFNNPAIDFMGGTEVQARFIKSHTPLQRQGTPDEVALMLVYLASDESAFVTAQPLSINGGAYN